MLFGVCVGGAGFIAYSLGSLKRNTHTQTEEAKNKKQNKKSKQKTQNNNNKKQQETQVKKKKKTNLTNVFWNLLY